MSSVPAESRAHLNPLEPHLEQQGYVVLDGALATELERRGADLNDPLWSAKLLIEAPELIKQVHADYLRAAADVITTASYQATLEGFQARGMSAEAAADLIRLSVTLAVEARDEFWSECQDRKDRLRPLVAASVGPYGAFLADGSEYSGDYRLTHDELVEFHRSRLDILSRTPADLIAFETIPSFLEGQALVDLLRDYPGLTAWIAFSCRDGRHVSHGERLMKCAALAESSGQVVAVGINCTAPRYIESLVREARSATRKPIVVYPNSGEGWDAVRGEWIPGVDDMRIGGPATTWYEAGARLIGGCCRTTPDDIAEIRSAMRSVR